MFARVEKVLGKNRGLSRPSGRHVWCFRDPPPSLSLYYLCEDSSLDPLSFRDQLLKLEDVIGFEALIFNKSRFL